MDFLHVSDDTTIPKLIEHKDPGATAWLRAEDAESATGYVVGGVVPSVMYSSCFVHRGNWLVGDALLNLRTRADRAGVTYDGIGVWTEGDVTFFDLVEIYHSRDDALRIARERGELAVFDRSTELPVHVGDTAAL